MEDEGIVDSIVTAFENLIDQVIDATPRIIAAFIIMLIGMFVASFLAKITKKLINIVERNKFVQKAEATAGLAGSFSRLAGKFVYWVVFVIFFSAAANVLDVPTLSQTIDQIVAYTPKLFAAAFVFAISYLGSIVLKDLVVSALKEVRFPMHKIVGIVVQTVILVFGVVTAAAQLGLDLYLLNNSLTVIIGGLALALALAFGLGGRGIAGSYLVGLANKSQLKEGQMITFDGMSGEIVSLGHTSAVLETKDGPVLVSYGKLIQ